MYDNDIQVDPEWRQVRIGTPVIASDGKQLGTVRDIRQDGLYVVSDEPSAEDYMVTAQDIGSVQADSVRLIVNSSQAMRAQASSPTTTPGGMAPGTMERDASLGAPSEETIGGIEIDAVGRNNLPPSS